MNDPRPTTGLLIVQLLALLALAGWWCSLTPTARARSLDRVAVEEQATAPPPVGVLAAVTWLTTHRLHRLEGLLLLGGLALIIGASEGLARRQQDVLGGFLLTCWTVGMVGMALLPGAIAGFVLAPWPLPTLASASVGAGLIGLTMYGLTAGRPYVP
jgi:hypothetical protein